MMGLSLRGDAMSSGSPSSSARTTPTALSQSRRSGRQGALQLHRRRTSSTTCAPSTGPRRGNCVPRRLARPGRRGRHHRRRRVQGAAIRLRHPARLPRGPSPRTVNAGRPRQDRALRTVPPSAAHQPPPTFVKPAFDRGAAVDRTYCNSCLTPPRRRRRDQVRHGLPLATRGRSLLPRGPHRPDPGGRLPRRHVLRPLHGELYRRRRGRGSKRRRVRGARVGFPARRVPRRFARRDKLRRLVRRGTPTTRQPRQSHRVRGGEHVRHVRGALGRVARPRRHLRAAPRGVRRVRLARRHPVHVRADGRFRLRAVRTDALRLRGVLARVRSPRRARPRFPEATPGGAVGDFARPGRPGRLRGAPATRVAKEYGRRARRSASSRDVRVEPGENSVQVSGPRLLPRRRTVAHAS